MSHTITGKLNKAARQHQGQNGMTFFVSLGEKNYDFKTKANVWTNYDVALFAKDGQIPFYTDNLIENAIVSVTGTGLILDLSNHEYPKLSLQDAKLIFVGGNAQPAQPAQPQYKQSAPQQGYSNQTPQQHGFKQQAPQQSYTSQSPAQQAQPYKTPQQQQGGFLQQAPQQQGGFQQQAKVNPQEPSIDFDDAIPF